MKVAYSKEEMVEVTELSSSLKSFVEKVKNRTIDKVVIMKNDQAKAVMISISEYERMKLAMEILEHHAIADIIDKRVPHGKIGETISLNEYHLKRSLFKGSV